MKIIGFYGLLKIFLLIVLGPVHLFAGAWAREKDELYSKLSVYRFTSNEVYAPKGNKKQPGPDFTDITTTAYNEYGFSPKWTGILSIAFKSLESISNGVRDTESGLGDAWLYIKSEVIEKPMVVSFQFGTKIPMGYSEKANPPLGQGQIDFEDRVLVGKSFYPWPVYTSAEIAYRKRNGDYSDEIPFMIEAGVNVSKKILFKLTCDGISNLSNDRASDLDSDFNDYVFDKEYMKVSPTLIFTNKHGYSFEIFYETLVSGANTAAGDTVGIGLAWQGKLKKS